MATYFHSFESGQASGTTISGANSATGGNAFNTVTIGTGATVTYDSTANRGSLSGRFTTGGTSAIAAAIWTSSTITAGIARPYGRAVIRRAGGPVGLAVARMRSGATQAARVTWDAAGKLQLRNTGNSVLATSAATQNTTDWWLVRWDITVGASATGVLYIHYSPTSATPDETLTANSADFGTGNVDECGWASSTANANVDMRLDDILLTGDGLPGPPAQSITISETITLAEAVARGLAQPRAVAESLTVADSPARALATSRAVAESLTLAETVGRQVAFPRAVPESLTLADSPVRVVAASRDIAETLTLSDAVSRAFSAPRAVAETLTMSDAVTGTVESAAVSVPATSTPTVTGKYASAPTLTARRTSAATVTARATSTPTVVDA